MTYGNTSNMSRIRKKTASPARLLGNSKNLLRTLSCR